MYLLDADPSKEMKTKQIQNISSQLFFFLIKKIINCINIE